MYNFIKNWVSTGDFLLFQSLIGNVQRALILNSLQFNLGVNRFNPS